MQNTPQAFRGAGAPGVNFSDHAYDNHVGSHCQPSGYQPYSNPSYHPVPSPRPHHYANHQMQQNMPYRHHGGAYAPNQNQYNPNVNQDMYRNHHSGYGGSNARNMPSKQWPENNSSDMMPPYGQVSHPPMMNNQQMPMRSPPHATSNMNPVPPQGQQHYRQMQSPAHSPHSWSPAQIPSPGVMHSSRTTPSPLSVHVRSPGHSQQPFSPPSAMNMPSHQPPPENGQLPQPINQVGSNDPANPLHSLQKMVMLEPDSKAMIPMMGDSSEPFPNQCDPTNYVPEDVVNESKESSYSTYYNMDENRFESKHTITNDDPSVFTEVQQVPNCTYPLQSPVNCEEMKNPTQLTNSNISQVIEQPLQSVPPLQNSSILQQCSSNVNQVDDILSIGECPPHAESAPVFTDQTKAAVSTNSEQALQSKSDWELSGHDEQYSEDLQNSNSPDELKSQFSINSSQNDPTSHTSHECNEDQDMPTNSNNIKTPSANLASQNPASINSSSSCASNSESNDIPIKCEQIKSESDDTCAEGMGSPGDVKSSSNYNLNQSTLNKENCQNSDIENLASTVKKEISPESTKNDAASKSSIGDDTHNSPDQDSNTNQSAMSSSSREDLNDLKVVIHRIHKCEESDTWHVPDENISSNKKVEEKVESKLPTVGPQIVILSPSSTPQKQFGFNSSVDSCSIITVNEESNDEIEIVKTISQKNKRARKTSSTEESSSALSPDKRRGRPVGSKTRTKASSSSRKKKSLKSNKKKKETSKQKPSEMPSKLKKTKIFSGPYVHIMGNKKTPFSISVINVAQREEEKLNKVSAKRSFSCNTVKKKSIGHMSTLSPTYDAFNRDKTWLCVFCHKGSHMSGLGDLYGPYYIKGKTPEKPPTAQSSRSKRRKSDHDDGRTLKKSRQASGPSIEITPISKKTVVHEDGEPELQEVWIHEDCAIWCQSVSLMAEEVQGLEDAVTEASEHVCCHCKNAGATLGCWGKACKEQYHFCCAKEIGCQMDIENFSLFCPKHQKNSSV